MIRTLLTGLATAVLLAGAAATPAFSENLKSNQQPTACDCSNCSAQHCQGGGDHLPLESISMNYGKAQDTRDLKAADHRD